MFQKGHRYEQRVTAAMLNSLFHNIECFGFNDQFIFPKLGWFITPDGRANLTINTVIVSPITFFSALNMDYGSFEILCKGLKDYEDSLKV
jgi:hypothetical protein